MPPAAKNHDLLDLGLKGVPPAAKNHDFFDFWDNFDILSGSEVFYFFYLFDPLLWVENIKKMILNKKRLFVGMPKTCF